MKTKAKWVVAIAALVLIALVAAGFYLSQPRLIIHKSSDHPLTISFTPSGNTTRFSSVRFVTRDNGELLWEVIVPDQVLPNIVYGSVPMNCTQRTEPKAIRNGDRILVFVNYEYSTLFGREQATGIYSCRLRN